MADQSSLDSLSKVLGDISKNYGLGSLSMTIRSPVTPAPSDDEVLKKATELVKANGGTLFSLSKLHDVPERNRSMREFGFTNSISYAPTYYGIYIADTRDVLGLKYEGIMGGCNRKLEENTHNFKLRIVEIGMAAHESTIGLAGIFDHVNSYQIMTSNAAEFAAFRDAVNAQMSKQVADYYKHVSIRALGHDSLKVTMESRKIPNELKMDRTFYSYRKVLEPLLRCVHILDTGAFESDIVKIDDKYEQLESHMLLQVNIELYGDDFPTTTEERNSFDDMLDYLISKANLLFRDSKLRDKPSAEDVAKLQNLIVEMRLKRLV